MLATLSSIGTALLMTHFLICLTAPPRDAVQECPAGLIRLWPAAAVGAILLPWAFYPDVEALSYALQFRNFVDGLWPIALGVGLAFVLGRMRFSPRVPVGDTIVFEEAAFRRLLSIGPSIETLDARLRQWPAAGLSLLSIVLALLMAGLLGS